MKVTQKCCKYYSGITILEIITFLYNSNGIITFLVSIYKCGGSCVFVWCFANGPSPVQIMNGP